VPLEAPYLCEEANDVLGCSKIKSEGIKLKAEHKILSLEDRIGTYSLEDSVGISGMDLCTLKAFKDDILNAPL
jgi:hypothetical protein